VLHLRAASAETGFNRLCCTCSHGCWPHRESGACVFRSSCRSIMPRQEEVTFIKALSTTQLSPAILRAAMSRRQKKPLVPAGIRRTISASGARAPRRLPSLLTGKRKANQLASSGDSSEPANRRPAPGAGSAPLPAVTGEHAASSSRHLVSPEGGETYAAVLAGSAAPHQPSGPLKPTTMDSDPSESAVSSETVNVWRHVRASERQAGWHHSKRPGDQPLLIRRGASS
jgi:hypothetical protein